jgi:SAM-dependent methyltransferase
MDNYQYCADFAAREIISKTEPMVLDFGCGAGQTIRLLRKSGVAAFGCEVFYDGGRAPVAPDLSGIILAMRGGMIPFPADMFDVVVNNQVMEHVGDLDTALSEIHRVLKPGGTVLSLFPDKSVWREGHCGIPFLHWFPKRSTLRIYYAFSLRCAGLGHSKGVSSRLEWSKDACRFLDRWTVYRTYDEIARVYAKYFPPMQHIEEHWLESRAGPVVDPFPTLLKRLFVNKMAGLVFTVQKLGPAEPTPASMSICGCL